MSSTIVPGVVVEPGRGIVYIMRPGGGIEALDIADGRVRWASNRADQPLFVTGERLFAVVESAASGLALATLDPTSGAPPAKTDGTFVLALPAGVEARIDASLEQVFTPAVRTAAGVIYLTWEFREREVTGVAPAGGRPSERRETGAFRFVGDSFEAVAPGAMPADGQTWPPQVEALSASLRRRPLRANGVIALAGQRYGPDEVVLHRWRERDGQALGETLLHTGRAVAVFASCDERHIVIAVADPEAPAALPYVLRYVDLERAVSLAEIPSRRSAGPFCIVDSRLLRLSQPERRRIDGKMTARPLAVTALHLDSGEVAWRRPVRDTAFRGAPPPRD